VEEAHQYLLRNIVGILEDGSVVCQGNVPPGSEVHLMIGNKDSCKNAATEAAAEIQQMTANRPLKLLIFIESVSRLKLLGRGAFQEIAMVKNILGENIPIIGMYSNGEVFPFKIAEKFNQPHVQNESMVILAVSE
ncbi:MAG: FIST C-terminal domain-containing protein, partial [Candidatus Omnitrophica bacterium]|nr:FIST C-terminal domain-containing protein [Candidatus Omnitrophota bacterium]